MTKPVPHLELVLSPAPPAEGELRCAHCKANRPRAEFHPYQTSWCKACHNESTRAYGAANRERLNAYGKRWRIDNAPRLLLRNAKKRAEEKGLPFSIVESDIFIPECCPVLGIALAPCSGRMHPNNPTIDRFIDAIGYVPGNITVISWRANCLKRDATADELETVAAWMRAHNRQGK